MAKYETDGVDRRPQSVRLRTCTTDRYRDIPEHFEVGLDKPRMGARRGLPPAVPYLDNELMPCRRQHPAYGRTPA